MVIADAGLWLALAARRDRYHSAARDCLERLAEPLVTTWPVVTEASYLLMRDLGPGAGSGFVCGLPRVCELHVLLAEDGARLSELMDRYADQPMDLADASLVLLAERLGHGRILTTDRRHFGAYRWNDHQPFENLLLDA
jgi:hypothetical protein